MIIDGDFLTAGGDGGGDGASGSSSSGGVTSSSSSGSTSNCTEGTCIGSGTNDCGCVRTCGTAVLQTKCALNDSKKLQCICSYDDVFSGACFETDVSLSCDMDKGCCAKYFKGI